MKHEKFEERCAAYSLGILEEKDQRGFEQHLRQGCSACEANLKELRNLVNSLTLLAEPVNPRADIKDKILRDAARQTRARQNGRHIGEQKPFLFIRKNAGDWQTVASGVAAKILYADAGRGVTTMLVRMAPGSTFASHTHHGAEELYMLEGECLCQGERLYAGDYHRAESGSTHGVTSTENGCLMLVISPEIEIVV